MTSATDTEAEVYPSGRVGDDMPDVVEDDQDDPYGLDDAGRLRRHGRRSRRASRRLRMA